MNPFFGAIALLTPFGVDLGKVRIGPKTAMIDKMTPDQVVLSYELTFIKTSAMRRLRSPALYPTAPDYPCTSNRERLLSFFPFVPTASSLSDFALCESRVSLPTALEPSTV